MKNILQITMIGLAILLSISAFGQKNHPHHRHQDDGILSMTEELQLTHQQVEKIITIQDKYKEQITAIKSNNNHDREALHGEMKTLFKAQSD